MTHLWLLALLAGCSSVEIGAELSEIALVDVNPNSVSYQQVVTAAEYQGSVSLWYFGHAT
jgi:hypothetical protein